VSCHWIAPYLHPLDRDWFEGRGYIFYPCRRDDLQQAANVNSV